MTLLKRLNILKMMRFSTHSILTMKMWNLQRCNAKLSDNNEVFEGPRQMTAWPPRLVLTKIQTSLAIADAISNSEHWAAVVRNSH